MLQREIDIKEIPKKSLTTRKKKYFGEVALSIKAESELDFDQISSLFNEDGVTVKLVLESNKDTIEPETLEVWSIDWEKWDNL